MTLRVAPAGHDAALYAVEHWHYSGTLPVPPRVVLGVWEDDAFIGAVIFSRGASSHLGQPYKLAQDQICELTRVALREHDAPVSQIVALALSWLRKANPGLRAVVSFADPAEGHHGGIYQAGNWIYSGDTPPSTVYYDKSGKKWHSRQLSATGVNTQFGQQRVGLKTSDCTAVKVPGKHRYLMPMDKATRRQFSKLAKPYPGPRGRSLDSETPEVLSGSAGATPADRSEVNV